MVMLVSVPDRRHADENRPPTPANRRALSRLTGARNADRPWSYGCADGWAESMASIRAMFASSSALTALPAGALAASGAH